MHPDGPHGAKEGHEEPATAPDPLPDEGTPMNLRRRLAAAAASGVALALGATVLAAAPASATTTSPGNRSLAAVLLSDGNQFDRNWNDYDIVTEAVLAVLAAKPGSPVKVVTDGDVALTAFLPRDDAFRRLVKDLTGTRPKTEKATFEAVAGLGIDTVETVLLYHVVPGATITRAQALKADGARLTTALGSTVKVDVTKRHGKRVIKLVDADRTDRNPRVVKADINKRNKQIAHGVDRVLRPIDLP